MGFLNVLDPTLTQELEGVVILVVSLLIWKFNLYERWRDFRGFTSKPKWGTFKVANFSNYEFISIAVTVAFLVLMVLYTNFGDNWITLRVATGSAAPTTVRGAGHWLVWVALFAVFVRHGAKDVLKGGYTMLAFGATHETLWYVFYLIALPGRITVIAQYYATFVAFVGSIQFGYALLFQKKTMPKKKLAVALGFMVLFYVMWAAAGFHISIDTYSGATNYYGNLDVNLVEDMSWDLYAVFWL